MTADDIKAKISSRKLLACLLKNIGIEEDKTQALYALLDKKAKLPTDTFAKLLTEQVPDPSIAEKVTAFMNSTTIEDVKAVVVGDGAVDDAIKEVSELFELLEVMGISEYCVFDPSIVRGLAYYTGIVFEVHDIVGDLRAIAGGGRYDDLLKQFGGPQITGTGMGMGDCVLEILLEEKGLLQKQIRGRQLDYFVACTDKQYSQKALEIAAKLRTNGFAANFSYKAGNLKKQMKQASNESAGKCIIIGEECEKNQLVIKDMATGEQQSIDKDEFFAQL